MAGYPPGPPLRPDGGSSGAPGVLSTFVMVGWCQDRAGYYGRRPFLTRKKDPLHPGGPSPSVREGGVEPPRPFGHTDLNRARLPIPPLAPEARQGYPRRECSPKPPQAHVGLPRASALYGSAAVRPAPAAPRRVAPRSWIRSSATRPLS